MMDFDVMFPKISSLSKTRGCDIRENTFTMVRKVEEEELL